MGFRWLCYRVILSFELWAKRVIDQVIDKVAAAETWVVRWMCYMVILSFAWILDIAYSALVSLGSCHGEPLQRYL